MPDANIQSQLWQQQPLFTAARLNDHDAQLSAEQLSAERQASVLCRSESLQQQSDSQGNLGMLRKSLSMGREPHTQKEALRVLKQIQRSSSGSVAKLPNSLPGSLSDTESGAFQRPTGALAEAGTLGRGSGSSTISGSIFGGSYQWVIEYSDLVSAVDMHASSNQLHLNAVLLLIQTLLLPCFSQMGARLVHCCFHALCAAVSCFHGNCCGLRCSPQCQQQSPSNALSGHALFATSAQLDMQCTAVPGLLMSPGLLCNINCSAPCWPNSADCELWAADFQESDRGGVHRAGASRAVARNRCRHQGVGAHPLLGHSASSCTNAVHGPDVCHQ